MTEFRAGIELARAFYADVVSGCLDVPHTACLIGEGSEVLGHDSPRSTDHEWGPRVQLLVAAEHVDRVRQMISNGLPAEFGGYPTSWYSLAQGRMAHHIEISTLADWLRSHFRIDLRGGLDYPAWLSVPQQHLLQLTQGAVFRDDDGELTKLRTSLAWYPTDVWLWLLATQWDLIAIEQPFLGRAVEAGDARGARLLVNRLCRLIMEMAFLQERHYWPYDKWFGTAFSKLKAAATLEPLLDNAFDAPPSTNASADGPVSSALIALGHQHNALGVTAPVAPATSHFRVGVNDAIRPYAVVNARDFINTTIDSITDPALRDLPPGRQHRSTHTRQRHLDQLQLLAGGVDVRLPQPARARRSTKRQGKQPERKRWEMRILAGAGAHKHTMIYISRPLLPPQSTKSNRLTKGSRCGQGNPSPHPVGNPTLISH